MHVAIYIAKSLLRKTTKYTKYSNLSFTQYFFTPNRDF